MVDNNINHSVWIPLFFRRDMMRKILLILLAGILFATLTGCTSKPQNTKLFTSKSSTITLEEPLTLYKTTDTRGAIIGTANAGQYKVLDIVTTDNEKKTWVKIEVNGVKGYILGHVVKE